MRNLLFSRLTFPSFIVSSRSCCWFLRCCFRFVPDLSRSSHSRRRVQEGGAMAKGSSKANPPRPRKRVEADTNTLKRARDGSAFTRCEACKKDVAVVLIDMHSCSLDSKIKMTLESQVVEKTVEATKPAEKKRAALTDREKKPKKTKKSKESSGRKRPPTAFFLFMDDFRKSFKEANPDNKSVSLVAKEGGEKWKSMLEEEKKPYVERAAELKAEFKKAVEEDNLEGEEEAGEKPEEETNQEEEEEEKEASAKEEEELEDED
ncbi:high mobility group B protein 7-like isoform X2 [Zingiber officinale]|uniref:high mobility group B protein 7-like isoform X2 n=1 Tax=Zingiber officinale TaxID=94328 RepID=UPI001C4C6A18|nr:high mobility group B protein 7-like isoform X2 [Zingiber officinale]